MAFINKAVVDGLYNNLPTRGTDLITIQDVNITVKKTSSSMVWIGGELIFTISVKNEDTMPYTEVKITDDLNEFSGVAELVESTITLIVGGVEVKPVPHTYVNGVLVVTVNTIPPNEEAILTFRLDEV